MAIRWRQRAVTAALPILVLALGLAVRLSPWQQVFTGQGVRLRADTDPHYHVLRAEHLLHGAPGAPWRDPGLNWPTGAAVPWPPLFDAAIAGAGWLSAGTPTRDDMAAAAAFVPVVLAAVTLLLLAALARRLAADRWTAWSAAAMAALIPAFSQHGELGRPDQHSAELLLFVAILLAHLVATQGEERSERIATITLAALVPVSFWTWMGSAALLAVPIAFAAAWHALSPVGDASAVRAARALFVGGLGGAVLLATSLGLLGPPGALASTAATGVSGLHVAIAAGAGAVGGLLLLAGRLRRGTPSRARLVIEALGSSLLPALLALGTFPALRAGTAQGLVALLASNPWYRSVGEFAPLFPGEAPFGSELRDAVGSLGLAIPASLLAVPTLLGRWRSTAHREIVFLLVLCGLFVPITFARQRFMGYAVVPLVLLTAAGLQWLAERVQRRAPGRGWLRGMVLALGVVAVAAPARPWALGGPWSALSESEEDALRWLRMVPAPYGRAGVLSQWSLGHAIQYFANKPVVASPFGTEGGPGAMEDWATFWYARAPEQAEAILAHRRIGFVVLRDPVSELIGAAGLVPAELRAHVPPARMVDGSRQVELTADSLRFVPLQLFFADGAMLPNRTPALAAYRLIYEGQPRLRETLAGSGGIGAVKVFAVGPGATLLVSGVPPGEVVEATVDVRTNLGRHFEYRARELATREGDARLRLPYATGWNGSSWVSPWSVRAGGVSTQVHLPEADVVAGRESMLRLDATGKTLR